MTDVRNISVVQSDSDTYKVKVYNVESKINVFPIVPDSCDSVTCHPGEQKPKGDMCTPRGGDFHMKQTGMLVGNFGFNP